MLGIINMFCTKVLQDIAIAILNNVALQHHVLHLSIYLSSAKMERD